jgi:sulfur transfer complex TusBCD TusB component (DsrH family)
MRLPQGVGTCVQIHPRGIGGLACLQDGSLVLFKFPLDAFQSSIHCHDSDASDKMYVDSDGVYLYLSHPEVVNTDDERKEHTVMKSFHVTCASFHGRGDSIYAATACGKLLCFHLGERFHQRMFVPRCHSTTFSEILQNYACFNLGENCVAREIVTSRNGQMLVLNCTDCLKLYNVNDVQLASLGMTGDSDINWKPRFVFQDVVSKVKWNACDFSGDGEYVVGGCNNNESGNKYELYFWNTATGKH